MIGIELVSKARLLRVTVIVAAFLTIALCLIGPLASDTVFPASPDHPNHTAAIVQAKQALDEGQFPLRVAPWQYGGSRYPHFQFYSWIPFWAGGFLYKFVFPGNPWVALKCVYLLALAGAGIFLYGALRRLGLTTAASIAGGAVYMTAPYLLTNIYSRGAFSETIAQAELPLLLWGLFSIFRGSGRDVLFGLAALSIGTYLLACTHIITFLYGLFFFAIFLAVLLLTWAHSWQRAGFAALGVAIGCLLAAHQLVPIVSANDLAIRGKLDSPVEMKKFSPLATVLAVGPVEPEPTGGTIIVPAFWPQVGLPILFALGLALYLISIGDVKGSSYTPILHASIVCLVFAILTCSGTLDIWRILPQQSYVIQFPYRLLAFAALFGAVIAGVSVELGQRRHGWLPMGMACLVLFSASRWQPEIPRNSRTLTQVVEAPDLGYGAGAFLSKRSMGASTWKGPVTTAPLITSDGWLDLTTKVRFSAAQLDPHGVLSIVGRQDSQARGCSELHVIVGANKIVVPTQLTTFTASVPTAALLQAAQGSPEFDVGFDSPCAFVPGPQDTRRLFMYASEWEIEPGTAGRKTIRGFNARRLCKFEGETIRCSVDTDRESELHMPILYYSGLLDVHVNGKESNVEPVESSDVLITKVVLAPGKSVVTARFVGSRLGNTISMVSLAGLLLGAGIAVFRYRKGR